VLAPAAPRVLAPRGLSHMHKYGTKSKGATNEVQCNMMHEQEQPKHINPHNLFYEITPRFSIYLAIQLSSRKLMT
jgi:hypothetical protein